MQVILFDIDGTLVRVHTAARAAVVGALEETFEATLSLDGVSFAGKTDPEILAEILRTNGHATAPGDARFDRALAGYERRLVREIDREYVRVLPGVAEILPRLSERSDLLLGLVTGNLATTARAKLEAAGLAGFFPFGAFGSDSADRNELPAVALERAGKHAGAKIAPGRAIVVGDTPRDIQCGARIGARTVAVCTGTVGREELRAGRPDLLLEDLTDPEPLLALLER